MNSFNYMSLHLCAWVQSYRNFIKFYKRKGEKYITNLILRFNYIKSETFCSKIQTKCLILCHNYRRKYMPGMKIYKGEFEKQLELLLAPEIKAGFPSPAQDYMRESLDFNRDFIRHPEATFYGRVDGDSMVDAGIDDGDIAVIDRSLEAQDGDIVVGYVNGEFTIKFLDLKHKADGYIVLRPANKKYDPIRVDEYDEFEVWGVVVWTIKNWKR